MQPILKKIHLFGLCAYPDGSASQLIRINGVLPYLLMNLEIFLNHFDNQFFQFIYRVVKSNRPLTNTLYSSFSDSPHYLRPTLTFWRRTFFQILAHPVFKM